MGSIQAPSQLQTVQDCLQWAEKTLENSEVYLGHGFDNYWDEGLALLLNVLGESWDADKSLLAKQLNQSQINSFLDLLEARINKRIPVAYLINESWFCALPFFVDETVLIPRSPIAELILDGFSLWFNEKPPETILDLCTGSGCIAIACAFYFEDAQVDASDLSEDALSIASKNVEKYLFRERVKLYRSDLFEQLPKKQYQLIISNPPYVDAEDMQNLPEEYIHEPAFALEAGVDGLLCVREILNRASEYLTEDGVLIVEVGNSQEAVMETFPDWPFLWLDFENGGHGVFALTKSQLLHCTQDL